MSLQIRRRCNKNPESRSPFLANILLPSTIILHLMTPVGGSTFLADIQNLRGFEVDWGDKRGGLGGFVPGGTLVQEGAPHFPSPPSPSSKNVDKLTPHPFHNQPLAHPSNPPKIMRKTLIIVKVTIQRSKRNLVFKAFFLCLYWRFLSISINLSSVSK